MAMNKAQLIKQRQGRYLAQAASSFEATVEPRIPKAVADQYKAILREKFKLFGEDAVAILNLDDTTELNAHAQALRDTFDERAGIGGKIR